MSVCVEMIAGLLEASYVAPPPPPIVVSDTVAVLGVFLELHIFLTSPLTTRDESGKFPHEG